MGKKKKQLSITGPKQDLDRMIEDHLRKYEFHLENAVAEFSGIQKVRPFMEENPYREVLNKEEALLKWLPDKTYTGGQRMREEEAFLVIERITKEIQALEEERTKLKEEKARISQELDLLEPYRMLDCDLKKLREFNYIKTRFGKIPMEYYQKFFLYVYDNLEAVFYECGKNADYAWGVYFVPAVVEDRVDALFSTVHFEKVVFPREYTGTTEEAYQMVRKEWKRVKDKSRSLKERREQLLAEHKDMILCAYESLKIQADYYNIKKMAACVNDEKSNQVYYILYGWMPSGDAKVFLKEIKQEENVYCFSKDV